MRLRAKPIAGSNLVKLALPVLVLHAAVAVAQTRPDAGTLLQETRPGTAPGPRGAVPLTQPAPSQFKGDNAKVKIRVTAFRFSGNTVFDEKQLAAIVAGEVNKELDFDGLEKAVEAVKQYYLSKGYFLAVPYLPQQDWTGGVVRIHVLEGRLGRAQVNTKPGSRVSASVGERYMSVLKPGAIATESDVYRQLLLLQDLPGVAVSATS